MWAIGYKGILYEAPLTAPRMTTQLTFREDIPGYMFSS